MIETLTSKKQSYELKHEACEMMSKVNPIVPTVDRVDLAGWVSAMTIEAGTMLPKTSEEVLVMFEKGCSVILVDEKGSPVAHGAITYLYEEQKTLEIGGILVDPKLRKKGLGTLATIATIELAKMNFPEWRRMALCNTASLPIFVGLGAKIVGFEDIDEVPKEAWEACLTCPNYIMAKSQGKVCCDTPVIIP